MKPNGLRIAYHPIYQHPLPEGHRFPMAKYELVPAQLLYEGLVSAENFFAPDPCPDEIILLAHDAAYLEKLETGKLSASEQRRIGFPQSPQLTLRERVITQGTIDCCRHALQNGVALNVAGGTHHAFRDRGEGFCLLNDFAVAANYLLREGLARQVLVIDLDVHQGNGTAAIFAQEPRVFTFSMHGHHNYPFVKEQSDRDIALPDGIGDEDYLRLLRDNLDELLDSVQPDFAFYLSGVDVLATDRFGKLKISMQGCGRRDELVFSRLQARGIPCAVAMGGGYSPQLRTIVDAHCQTFRAAAKYYG